MSAIESKEAFSANPELDSELRQSRADAIKDNARLYEEARKLRADNARLMNAVRHIESFAGNDPRCDRDPIIWQIYSTARAALKEPSHG